MSNTLRSPSFLMSVMAAGTIGSALLAGCTSSGSAPEASYPSTASPATPTQTCKVFHPGRWTGVSSDSFNTPGIAERLGVPLASVTQAGRFGSAVCTHAIKLKQMDPIGVPAIVAVPGEGSPCLVVGSGEDPSLVTETKKIGVVCANPV